MWSACRLGHFVQLLLFLYFVFLCDCGFWLRVGIVGVGWVWLRVLVWGGAVWCRIGIRPVGRTCVIGRDARSWAVVVVGSLVGAMWSGRRNSSHDGTGTVHLNTQVAS